MDEMLLTVLLLNLIAVISGVHFIKSPSNAVYQRGTENTGYVACEVDPPSLRVIWNIQIRDKPIPEVIYSSPDFFSEDLKAKYSVNADAGVTGNYTLIIHNLNRDDSGRYTCQGAEIGAQAANITVADPPGAPEVTLPSGTLQEGQTKTFSCISRGGFPVPTFTWFLRGTQLPTSKHRRVIEAAGVARSELTLELSHTHHRAELSCIATNVLSKTNSSKVLDVQYSPRVTVSQTDLVVLKDESFELSCDVDANPRTTGTQWLSGQTTIFPATFFDNGVSEDTVLTCRAENELGIGEAKSEITVHYPPVVKIVQGETMNVSESNEIKIKCDVDSKPAARVQWYKDGKMVKEGAELVVASATRQDGGRYRCQATNTPSPSDGTGTLSTVYTDITVNVQYGPEVPTFEVNPSISSGDYRAGQQVVLKCSTTDPGSPAGIIKWYKKDKSTALETGPSLRLDSPQVSHSGIYWCQVENSVSSAKSEEMTLNFMDVPVLLEPSSKKELNKTLGSTNIQVHCEYRGFPTPTVQWYRGNKAISGDMGLYTIEQTTAPDTLPYHKVTSTLKFIGENRENGLVIEDFAQYRCVASNSVGESEDNYQVQLNVIFSPVFTGFGKAAAEDGLDVNINCLVHSYPPATSIKFFRDGNLITSTNKHSLSALEVKVDGNTYLQKRTLKLTTVSAEDFGKYKCEAVNREGTAATHISLIKTSSPDTPTSLTHTNITWSSVSLAWSAAFDGGYSQMFTVEEMTEKKSVEGIKETHFTFQGLSPSKTYKFQVYASNKRGGSEKSEELSVTTLDLDIPASTLVFDEETKTVAVTVNSTEFCTKLQGRVDNEPYVDVLDTCIMSSKKISVESYPYTSYRVATCVVNRPDICRESSSIAAQTEEKKDQKVIIAVAVSIFLVLLIIVVVVAVVILRKKRLNSKSSANTSKSGHVNPIMTPNGVPGKVHYSSHNEYNINSDLDDDELDGLPYGEFKNPKAESPTPAQQMQNFDYVYASVQKKSSEQNKMNDNSGAFQDRLPKPNNLNIHDPLSVSDNSEVGYDEQPPSPYRSPNDLAFLGNGAMAFHRYPSISESGYSTPDSKQLKKVVYEVIV